MTTPILIATALLAVCIASAYTTARICNREIESEWQVITYTSSEVVVPKEIYICKRCNYKSDLDRHYCSNCGSLMKNGMSYHCYSDKIELSE